jgi:GH24 family phage-related lysozyme (muramidase)
MINTSGRKLLRMLKKPKVSLADAELMVREEVKVPLRDHQYNATVGFVSYYGSRFKLTRFLRLLNEGNYLEAALCLERYSRGKKSAEYLEHCRDVFVTPVIIGGNDDKSHLQPKKEA